MNKKVIFLISVFLFPLSLFSCSYPTKVPTTVIKEENNQVGNSVISTSMSTSDVSVIFFDDDNLISSDGMSYSRSERQVSNTLGSSDCYMVKSGTCEMLVDCGYQSVTSYGSVTSNLNYINQYVKKNFQDNLQKKIATVLSDDGVLDYLIVTHADYDHIASLIVDGGLFDSFLTHQTITDLNGKDKTFTRINYIIDFDSGLVKKFSDSNINKESRLVRSDEYQSYVHKRNLLVQDGTSYCPASAFYDNAVFENYNFEMSEENRNLSMPDAIIKRLQNAPNINGLDYILSENSNKEVTTKKNAEYKNEPLLSNKNGEMKYVNSGDTKRFYYSLKFNACELRILYNWHYDYIYHKSFNENEINKDEKDGSTQIQDPQKNIYDSQDANNISVCFEICKGNFKFLSLGDLGGNGENGLLKYYENTDLLKNISLFKVSHHGSTYNGENSEKLFRLINPEIVVITGCAIYKDPNWKSQNDDQIMSALTGRTKIKQEFFDHISKGTNNKNVYILCTNIENITNSKFESVPFYGDIKVEYIDKQIHLSYSFVSEIKAYISQAWNSSYYQENKKEYCFSTRKNKKYIKYQDTDWFKNIGYSYGG